MKTRKKTSTSRTKNTKVKSKKDYGSKKTSKKFSSSKKAKKKTSSRKLSPRAQRSSKPAFLKKSPTTSVRLNKYIADSGFCSRRKADEYIDSGEVSVNGRKVFELGIKVNPQKDSVRVGKKLLKANTAAVYFVMNKPTQVLTSMSDPSGRPTVADFMKKYKDKRLFPVGRLDWDSEGLLILTNDGDYAQKVSHPKEEIPKTYHVKIDRELTEPKKQKLLRGFTIVGGRVRATEVFRMKKNMRGQKTFWVSITITEGKNRQVRRMFEKLEIDVVKLRRVSIGDLKIGALKKGQILQLTPEKAMKVFKTAKKS